MKNKKQSIILAGLITTSGVFLSKIIGILYMVPFARIAGAENLVFYGQAYNIYSYLLNVFTAGFPFAIATLVTRYVSIGDYQTTFLIKKLAKQIMAVLGFIAMCTLILLSGFLAPFLVSNDGNNIEVMRTTLIILSIALFFVPYLSAFRGFYQGMKEMEVYAISQVLEQFSRVIFLLGCGALAVYVFHTDRIWAVYFAVLSAGVAAILAILHIKLFDRKMQKEYIQLAAVQPVSQMKEKKEMMKEILHLSIPYLLMAIFGYSDMIINSLFLPSGLAAFGYSKDYIDIITGSITSNIQKLMSIPMVLAPGFSAAIIPCITAAVMKRDQEGIRKNISDCISSVLYIGIPISFCLFAFAKPIYYVMYDHNYLDLHADILRWYSLEAFLSTIGPIITSLLMACGLRRLQLKYLAVYAILKGATTYLFIAIFGYPGSVLSTLLAMSVSILLSANALNTNVAMKWRDILVKTMKICICTLSIWGVSLLCNLIGLKGYDTSMVQAILQLAISGSLAIVVYAILSYALHLPQDIFNFNAKGFVQKIKRK